MKGIDLCKGCTVPETAAHTDPFDYEDYFCCADCACKGCRDLHHCTGQCGKEDTENGKNTIS